VPKVDIATAAKCIYCGEQYQDRVGNSIHYKLIHKRLDDFFAKHRHCHEKVRYEQPATSEQEVTKIQGEVRGCPR